MLLRLDAAAHRDDALGLTEVAAVTAVAAASIGVMTAGAPEATASARNAPIWIVTSAGPGPSGFTSAASFPWNIGRVYTASLTGPRTATTSVMSGRPARNETTGAKSRV
jgi:hypothetical protein